MSHGETHRIQMRIDIERRKRKLARMWWHLKETDWITVLSWVFGVAGSLLIWAEIVHWVRK